MSREELAEAAGISASYLYEVERGLKRPSTDVLAKLAAAFGMLPSQVLEYMERQMAPPTGFRAALFSLAPPASRREWAGKAQAAAQPAATPPGSPNPEIETLTGIARELDDQDLHILLELARRLRRKKP